MFQIFSSVQDKNRFYWQAIYDLVMIAEHLFELLSGSEEQFGELIKTELSLHIVPDSILTAIIELKFMQ